MFPGIKTARSTREHPAGRDAAAPVGVLRARAVRARCAGRAGHRARHLLHQEDR